MDDIQPNEKVAAIQTTRRREGSSPRRTRSATRSGRGGLVRVPLDLVAESENPSIVVVAPHQARRISETEHPFGNITLEDRARTDRSIGSYAIRPHDPRVCSDPHALANDRTAAVARCADMRQLSDGAVSSDPALTHPDPPKVADEETRADVSREREPDVVRHPGAAAEEVVDRPAIGSSGQR
jgi:hypothetical protein